MADTTADPDALLRTALTLADAARAETLPWFRRADLAADDKGGAGRFDPVTAADRAAEAAMRAILARDRPDDAILGEEFGITPGTSGITWVLDPIDGTRAFLAGAPTWGVLIAASSAAGPVVGVIDQPFIGERFIGTPAGAWTEGPQGRADLRTRPPRSLDQALLLTTFPEVGTEAERAGFHSLSACVRLTRYGLDCYGYAMLAAGGVDLVVEAGLHPYDIHAPAAVIAAAGGIVTDWRGGPAHDGGRVLAAANAAIHAEALAILSQVPE